jgi:hypothetical protein
MNDSEHIEPLVRARQAADNLARSLLDQIPIAALPMVSKIPVKVLSLREMLLHRASALASPAVALFEAGNIVSGILLTRALMETVAMMADLNVELGSFLKTSDNERFDAFLMNSLFANRHNDGGEMAIYLTKSILYSIDRLNKIVKGIRSTYDALSEYCHPNWSGVHGSFGSIDTENFVLDLGPKVGAKGIVIGATALEATLGILVLCYDAMPESILALNRHFEPDWREG